MGQNVGDQGQQRPQRRRAAVPAGRRPARMQRCPTVAGGRWAARPGTVRPARQCCRRPRWRSSRRGAVRTARSRRRREAATAWVRAGPARSRRSRGTPVPVTRASPPCLEQDGRGNPTVLGAEPACCGADPLGHRQRRVVRLVQVHGEERPESGQRDERRRHLNRVGPAQRPRSDGAGPAGQAGETVDPSSAAVAVDIEVGAGRAHFDVGGAGGGPFPAEPGQHSRTGRGRGGQLHGYLISHSQGQVDVVGRHHQGEVVLRGQLTEQARHSDP
jgi:hypothetical protein